MKHITIAFWNVENLFDPSHLVGRGPRTGLELEAKLDRIAACMNEWFRARPAGRESPALIGLAEVSTEDLLLQLKSRLTHRFEHLWQPAVYRNQTGLGILYRDPVQTADITAHQTFGRPRSILARCHLNDNRSFLFGVNHWKSRMKTGGADDHMDRMGSADWLRQEIQNQQEACVVLAGDFNAEPIEAYFDDLHLRGARHFSKALYRAAQADRLYNTAWRFLAEPRLWEHHLANAAVEPRPKGTHSGGFLMWDQLLVSGYALRGLPLQLIEESVKYYCGPLNAEYNRTGVLKPARWNYNGGSPTGASDHLPVLAEFEIK